MKKLETLILAMLLTVAVTCFAGIGTVNVGPTATQVLPATGGTAAWRWLILQNPSTNDVYLKLDSSTNAVTISNGIKLPANGGTISLMATGSANPVRNAISAISASGTNAITYQGGADQ